MSFEKWLAKRLFWEQDRLDFYRQMASLMRAGVTKIDAVGMAWKVASHEGRKPKETKAIILKDIQSSMRNGLGFGQAARKWVPADDAMVLEATENSDSFPMQLDRYCDIVARKGKIRGTIIAGLLYPIALLIAIYGLMVYFGSEVVPQVAGLMPTEEWEGIARVLVFMQDFAQIYAIPAAITIVLLLIAMILSMPRWARRGRSVADRMPIYSMYRMYTGISFMVSVASLVDGGLPAVSAVDRIRPLANPYVRHRLNLIRSNMLNGMNFGAALHAARTGWPDPQLNLSIKIFAESHDLGAQLHRLAKDWLERAETTIERAMGLLRAISLLLVFLVIMSVVAGMYDLQDQIAVRMNAGV